MIPDFSREMFSSLNQLRTKPFSFLPTLKTRYNGFRGKTYYPDFGNPQATIEGQSAVE